MVTTPDRQEPHERDLHARKCPKSIPSRVAHIQPRTEPSHANQHKRVQRQQVRDEDVASPCANHVSIEQRGQRSPHHTANLHSLDPQVESEDQQEDGNSLVIVASCHRAGDVSWRYPHENRCEQTRGWTCAHLFSEEVCCEGCEAGEGGRKEHAYVADVDWHC
jgi:hypothetical protein